MCLAGDGTREQRLAGPWGTGKQHPVRHAAAKAAVSIRALEEIDDLGQLELCLIDPSDIRECHPDRLRVDAARARATELAERTHPAAGRGAAHEQDDQPDDQECRAEAEQDLRE